ncbi:MAG: alpha/beta fold hydrolase [Parvibaculaceae bacterium]
MSANDWVMGGAFYDTTAGRIFYRDEGSGPVVVLFHGFPTWSYDWAEIVPALSSHRRVITLDFPGYGFSEKRRGVDFSVGGSANAVEQLLAHLGITNAALAIHDFGGIVGQELLDRRRHGRLPFAIDGIHVLNCGIVYAAYRPTQIQKLLALPAMGAVVASQITKEKLLIGLNAVRGPRKLEAAEFDELWTGIGRDDGHKLAHRHIRYNAERAVHHERWESALFDYDGPLQLIWGLLDPVSGKHVLDLARPRLSNARIVELSEAGHFPQSEAPQEVAAAIRGAFG